MQTSAQEPSVGTKGPQLPSNIDFTDLLAQRAKANRLKAFAASAFLVAVPVFIQAPLVRILPALSLAITGLWLLLGWAWLKKPSLHLWGDLVIGFSWTWLAGAIYWGWFRWNPYIHLPIEAVGLPVVLILMG